MHQKLKALREKTLAQATTIPAGFEAYQTAVLDMQDEYIKNETWSELKALSLELRRQIPMFGQAISKIASAKTETMAHGV